MLTQRDFRALAHALAIVRMTYGDDYAAQEVVRRCALQVDDYLRRTNPRYDSVRFLEAVAHGQHE